MTARASITLSARPSAVAVMGGLIDAAEVERQVSQRLAAELELIEAREAQLASAIEAMRSAAEQFQAARDQLADQARQQVVDLALAVAAKVLMQQVQAGQYEIDPIVAEALKDAPPRRQVVVHLCQADLERCQLAAQPPAGVTFQADPGLSAAQCVVVTPEGIIESSVQQGLAAVAEALRAQESAA